MRKKQNFIITAYQQQQLMTHEISKRASFTWSIIKENLFVSQTNYKNVMKFLEYLLQGQNQSFQTTVKGFPTSLHSWYWNDTKMYYSKLQKSSQHIAWIQAIEKA